MADAGGAHRTGWFQPVKSIEPEPVAGAVIRAR